MQVPITPDISVDLDDQDAECLRKMLLIPGSNIYVDSYGYAVYQLCRYRIKVHQLVGYWAGIGKVPTIDHENTVKLDCRRDNLRPATKGQQIMNRGPNRRKVPGPKGVYKRGNGGKPFLARVYCNGVCYNLGSFLTEDAASAAYNDKAKELFGDYARLNKIPLARRLISAWRADRPGGFCRGLPQPWSFSPRLAGIGFD